MVAMITEPLRVILHQPWGGQLVPIEWRSSMVWLQCHGDQFMVWRAVIPGIGGMHEWDHGCERDDWRLGPESRVIDPWMLIPLESRGQLIEVLAAAEVIEPPAGGEMRLVEVVKEKTKPVRRRKS